MIVSCDCSRANLAIASPIVNRTTFGCPGKSRVPAPYPDFSIFIAGNVRESCGQRLHDRGPGGRHQFHLGAGRVHRRVLQQLHRCRCRDRQSLHARTLRFPPPTFSGEQTLSSTASASAPTAAQTISTIASTAPTSWKWTFSIDVLWILASAAPSASKMPIAVRLRGLADRRLADDLPNLAQAAAMFMLRPCAYAGVARALLPAKTSCPIRADAREAHHARAQCL